MNGKSYTVICVLSINYPPGGGFMEWKTPVLHFSPTRKGFICNAFAPAIIGRIKIIFATSQVH